MGRLCVHHLSCSSACLCLAANGALLIQVTLYSGIVLCILGGLKVVFFFIPALYNYTQRRYDRCGAAQAISLNVGRGRINSLIIRPRPTSLQSLIKG